MLSMLRHSREVEPIMGHLVHGGQIIMLRSCSIPTVTTSRRSSEATDTVHQVEAANTEVKMFAQLADRYRPFNREVVGRPRNMDDLGGRLLVCKTLQPDAETPRYRRWPTAT